MILMKIWWFWLWWWSWWKFEDFDRGDDSDENLMGLIVMMISTCSPPPSHLDLRYLSPRHHRHRWNYDGDFYDFDVDAMIVMTMMIVDGDGTCQNHQSHCQARHPNPSMTPSPHCCWYSALTCPAQINRQSFGRLAKIWPHFWGTQIVKNANLWYFDVKLH